jgi:predicted O-methyltransferase YrrM
MNGITDPAVDQYMLSVLPARGAILEEMEEQARKRDIPIVGPAVGRLLHQYARLINAKRVFELGSAIGYSTLWWAQAVGDSGEVYYTDGDPKKAEEARGYFERTGLASRIRIGVGDAIEQFAEQKQEFDIVFNDIDKEGYPRVLDFVVPRLRRGGLFITDNALWYGRVTEQTPKAESTRAVQEFNRRLYGMKEFFTTILPLRDGLAVAVKG